MLKVDGIDTNYGAVAMLRDVSFDVAEGEFVCILGPNGAGKTTTFRALSGLLPLARGRIELMGLDLAGQRTESLSALGVGFVPEAGGSSPRLASGTTSVSASRRRRRRARSPIAWSRC